MNQDLVRCEPSLYKGGLSLPDHCFNTVWQNDTKSHACPDSICNHSEQSVESCVKALWGAIWAISKQHLPQPRKDKKKSFPQRSWAHFEHIIVLLFPYSLITVQSDYRVENKGRGWKIPATIDEVQAGLFVSLSTLGSTLPFLLNVGVTLSKLGKVELYKNTVCVDSRWNCMSHPFGFHNVKA